MTTDQNLIDGQLDAVAEDVAEYARQIESGEYGNRWTVQSTREPVDHNYADIIAADEEAAIAIAQERSGTDHDDWEVERDSFDEPTIVDEYDNESNISEWPLEVVVRIGRPLSVLITSGGPHIEIVHDLSDGSAKLAGYWGGDKGFRYGSEYQTVLDYFTDSLLDQAPEEWK